MYQFACNNPTNFIDALGLCDKDCKIVITSGHGPSEDTEEGKSDLEKSLYDNYARNRKDNANGHYYNLPLGCNTNKVINYINSKFQNKKRLNSGIPAAITGTTTPTYELGNTPQYNDNGEYIGTDPTEAEKKNIPEGAIPTGEALENLLSEADELAKAMCERGPVNGKKCKSVTFEIADTKKTDFVKNNRKGLEKRLSKLNRNCKK